MVLAHYVPWRATRTGKYVSDSKGASSAFTAEVAIQSVHRALDGFVGPQDILRNKDALFRYLSPSEGSSDTPFDIYLGTKGSDFSVMGMHFKLGLYEQQMSGAIDGLFKLILEHGEKLL